MEFYETPDGRLGLRDIPPVVVDLLRLIPRWTERESEAAEARLFPNPSSEPGEDTLRDDWKAYVQPELHVLFQDARQIVEADLRGMKEEDDTCFMEFPVKHAEAWISALNQARLALAAQHGLEEREFERDQPREILNERDLALLQIDFYAGLQLWLVEIIDR
ncbi:hypothetical protein BH09VER1_BH09VER1_23300 [soil metagenome]